MKAYIYQAALLCEECTRKRINTLLAGSSREIADTGDSDDFPQGPYSDGGGESDTPQHCDHCAVFLENPLTADGEDYVRYVVQCIVGADVSAWRERYAYLFTEDEG